MTLFNIGWDGADLVGYLASVLVLATFTMRSMLTLRVLGLASNVAFISYAVMSDLEPILLLHMMLFPINLFRLWELLATSPDEDLVSPDGWTGDGPETRTVSGSGILRNFPPDPGR